MLLLAQSGRRCFLSPIVCGLQMPTAQLHDTQNADRSPKPQRAYHDKRDNASDAGHTEHVRYGHVPQNLGKLRMCQGQSPESEVGSGVGDAPEAELDGVNDLMDHDFSEIMLFLSIRRKINVRSGLRFHA